MKLYLFSFYILLCTAFASITAVAGDEIAGSKLVPVGEWVLGVSVGFGSISNPLFKRDDIPLLTNPLENKYKKLS